VIFRQNAKEFRNKTNNNYAKKYSYISINPKSIILLPYEILTAIMQIVENELAKGRKL
jgi:hypothetical protein